MYGINITFITCYCKEFALLSGFKITITLTMNASELLYVVPKEGYVNRFSGRYVQKVLEELL